VQSDAKIAHDVPKLKKALAKLGKPEELRVVYEAGPTGFGLCRALREWGVECVVVAPSLIPRASGDRVKTDRLDACKLAQFSFGGLLTEVRVPDEGQEALRDLVRAREAAMKDQIRARHQLSKLLLRRSVKSPPKTTKWSQAYNAWVRALRFEEQAAQYALEESIAEVDHQSSRVKRMEGMLSEAAEKLTGEMKQLVRALQGLKGVRFLTAITIASEIGEMTRFAYPTQLMSYAGMVPGEHSSGEAVRRGAITKAGNAHLRRVIGESAWSYSRGISTPGATVAKRREGLSAEILRILDQADHRLRGRYRALEAKGKHRNKVTTAVGRELLGFIWAIGVQVHNEAGREAA
jgi:transposase